MFKLVDRTKFNTSTQGTGDIAIGSVSSSQFYLPSDVGAADGDTVRYIIVDGTDVEEGVGTIADSVATLQRTTVSKSKVGGVAGTSKLNLSGLAVVSLTASGADILVPANNLADVEDAATARTNLGTTAVGDAVLTAADKAAARTAIASPLRGHCWGLTLSTAGSSAIFGVASGEAADSTGVDLMALASDTTKATSAWSSGTGNGALDTGTIANTTWYHAHVIKNPSTGAVDVLVSLSATDPTLPSGFTLFRRIGSMKTDGSAHWTAFAQVGDVFRLDPPSTDVIAQSPGTGGTNYTLTTPTGVSVEAFGYGFWGVDGSAQYLIVYSPLLSTAPPTPSVSSGFTVTNGNFSSAFASFLFSISTNTSGQISAKADNSGGDLYLCSHGWIDRRGRDG